MTQRNAMPTPAAANAAAEGLQLDTPARIVVVGVITGVTSVALFGLAHAIVIVPIWDRLAGGVPFGVVAGVAVCWAYSEAIRVRPECASLWRAAQVGLLLWLAVLPTTTLGAALRLFRLHDPESVGQMAAAIVVAAAAGAGLGAWRARNRRGAMAFATASVVLVLAMAGPVPVTNSARAALLFAALLGICVSCTVLTRLVAGGLARLASRWEGRA